VKNENLKRLEVVCAIAEQIIALHGGIRFVDKETAGKIIARLAKAREAVTCQAF
jgi:hypothetical protein